MNVYSVVTVEVTLRSISIASRNQYWHTPLISVSSVPAVGLQHLRTPGVGPAHGIHGITVLLVHTAAHSIYPDGHVQRTSIAIAQCTSGDLPD